LLLYIIIRILLQQQGNTIRFVCANFFALSEDQLPAQFPGFGVLQTQLAH